MNSHNLADVLNFGGLRDEVVNELMIKAYDTVVLNDAEKLVFFFRVGLDSDSPLGKSLRTPEQVAAALRSHYGHPVEAGYVISVCDQVEFTISRFIWRTVDTVMSQHLGLDLRPESM